MTIPLSSPETIREKERARNCREREPYAGSRQAR
jgi:hypothetical protein